MNGMQNNAPDAAALRNDVRWQLALRVEKSEIFRRSQRLRTFLLFVVERSLAHPEQELNEYQVALEVFGRSENFNPAEASIVRSTARQLRMKLQEYFQTEGIDEPLILEIPKGSYAPEFRRRIGLGPAVPAGQWRIAAYAASALCLVLGVAVVWLWTRGERPAAARVEPRNLVSSVFRQARSNVGVVLCDSALVVVNAYREKVISLEEYIAQVEQTPMPLPMISEGGAAPREFPGRRLITSFRDSLFAVKLAEMNAGVGPRFEVRHSRLMQARDFKSGDFLLMGSTWSNPWVKLFENRLNFRFEKDPAGRFGIRNVSPQGEREFYWTSAKQGRDGVSCGYIAAVPNLSGTGKVLMISGLHAESSEGAAEAALAPAMLAEAERLAGRRLELVPEFELLLEISAVDGTVRGRKLIASRFSK